MKGRILSVLLLFYAVASDAFALNCNVLKARQIRNWRSAPKACAQVAGTGPEDLASLPLPPGDLGLPLLGDKTFKFAKEGSAYLASMHEKYGDVYKQRLFFTNAIVVTGLENLKKLWLSEHVLVEAEVPSVYAALLGEKGIFMTKGDAHTKLKQQLSKGFSPVAVHGYLAGMQSLTEQFCDKWAQQRTILGVDAAKDLSFAIILEVVMGFDRSIWSGDVAQANRIRGLYAAVQAAMFAPPINLPGTPFRRALRARQALLAEIEASLRRVAAERGPTAEGAARSVAAILLDATDDEGGRLSMEQIKDVTFNMLDAGQDTTGYTLASILLSLASDSDALARLRAEHAAVAARHGRDVTEAALRDMVYTDAVIKEALRNASPLPHDDGRMRAITVINVKRALRDFDLAGFRVPAGYTVIGNAARMAHTDPRWEGLEGTPEDKRKFCPARWLTDAGRAAAGGAFMPFAAGPRACLGSALATAELKVALAVLARGYEWARAAGPAEPVRWKSDPFPHPLDRLPLVFTKRAV